MDVIVVRGTEANRTSERISKIVKRNWGAGANYWIEHYDRFALVFNRPYSARRDIGYDYLEESDDW